MARDLVAQVVIGAPELREIDTEAEIEERSRSEFIRRAALADARRKRAKREGRES